MARVVVVNPPPMTLIVTATFMLLSVHIASGENASPDVTTEASSINASESAGTNDSTLAPLHSTTEITADDTTMAASYNSTENIIDTTMKSSYNSTEKTEYTSMAYSDNTPESTYSTVTSSVNTNESTNDTTGTSADSSAYSETAQTTENITTPSDTQSTAAATSPTTPATTEIPFGNDCASGGKCASNLNCDNTTKKCICLSDQYYNKSSNACLSKKNQGDSCGATSECKYNLTCLSGKCDCSDGFYYSSSQGCLSKKNQGDNCGATSECKSNLTCVSNRCNCSDGFYFSSSQVCLPKRDHGEVCQSGQPSDQCKVPNTVCTSYQSSSTKCLCANDFYWADNSSCFSKNKLDITATATVRETRAITFTWTDISHRSDVNYNIKWDVSNITGASKTGVTVTGLEPGTSYSFTVVTSLPADGNYSVIQVNQTQNPVWTFPDTPGLVTGSQHVNSVYEVTFGASNGSVSQYTMSVSLGGSTVETQTSTSTVMNFTQLKPATTYSYSLSSSNRNGDQSVPVTGQFTTAPEASGPVMGLTLAGVQSHAANFTWQTPEKPNGNITGYLVEVALQDITQCLYYFKIPCNGCTELVPTNFSVPNCNPMNGKFSSSGNVSNLELSDLKSYHNYTVKVQAVNEKGLGNQTSVTFQTSIAAQHDISDLTVNSVRNETTKKVDLYITWTSDEQTGPTDYYILIQEASEPDTEVYNQNVSPLTVTGYSHTNYVKYDVLAYWNYKVSVWAHTEAGNSSLKSEVNRTVENYPGPVENLNLTQDSATANIVILTFECPVTRSQNGRIDKFVINQTLLDPQGQAVQEKIYNHSASEGQSQPCSKRYNVIAKDIIVERTYLFTVMTVNNKYEGGLITTPNFDVKPQVPRPDMLKTSEVDSLVKQQDTSTEQTKITTAVCSRCLTDARWGVVRNVGLLVCVKGSTNCTQPGRKKRSTDLNFTQLPSWANAKQQGFKILYRTTPDNWMPPTSGNDIYQTFVVGENTSCTEANTADYCNGPLPAGKEFIISVIMCTTAGCTIYQETSVFRTAAPEDDSSQDGAIVGGVLGGLAMVALIGGILFLVRRQLSRREKTEYVRNNTPTQVSSGNRHTPTQVSSGNGHTSTKVNSGHTQVTSGNKPTPMKPPTENIPLPQMGHSSHIYEEIGDYDYINYEGVHPDNIVMKDEESSRAVYKNTRGLMEQYFPYENVVQVTDTQENLPPDYL